MSIWFLELEASESE